LVNTSNEVRTNQSVIYSGKDIRALAICPDGKSVAVAEPDAVVVVPASRRIPIAGIRELEWGRDLMAGDGHDLWVVPPDGAAPIRKEMPGNRQPGFSLHPDGCTIAITAGNNHSEIRAIRIAVQD
jgi:hypothetical protein